MPKFVCIPDVRSRRSNIRRKMDTRQNPIRLSSHRLQKSYTNLRRKISDNKEMAQLLIESDPEIDLEAAGRKTGPTDRVLLDQEGKVLYSASVIEIVYDANGHVIDRRESQHKPMQISQPNRL